VIQQIEQQWPKKRLLVLGDVMLDKYIWGEVGRISPEAPVPVVRTTHQSERQHSTTRLIERSMAEFQD
jgi:D-beta-D-heptose 7-phosphate kinase/D-beta-D-heptose 1-phosphate adenosyltransferase